MIRTVRINIYRGNESERMETAAAELLATVGLTLDDIRITGIQNAEYGSETHFGNWVIVPCLDHPALANLPTMQTWEGDTTSRVDLRRGIIEGADIDRLQIGQRVKVIHDGIFGMSTDEGRILRKDPVYGKPAVQILKKGARSKGWEVRTGDFAEITPL